LYIIQGMTDIHKKTIQRIQVPYLVDLLMHHPVVILHGARQTGKTTLTQLPEIGTGRTYLTLDDFQVLDIAQRDPIALFVGRDQITLDEVQRRPDLLLAIKSDVDQNRTSGRFLLTGSANLLLMEKASESLAGRAVYCSLPPLTWAEIEQVASGTCLDILLKADSVGQVHELLSDDLIVVQRTLAEAILAGGYPVPALSDNHAFRTQWFDGYVQTYLERDLRLLSATENLVEFRRLMQIVALRNGTLLNIASVANDAGLSPTTARRYMNLLEISFQIVRVPAYAVNRGKRLVKSPKVLWTDTGLAAFLAGLFDQDMLVESREWGHWVESWVGIHLLIQASLKNPRVSVFHWRTSNGHEVDFVLEWGQKLIPLEVKTTRRPTHKDLRGLHMFLETYPKANFGVLACLCEKPHMLSSKILAVPLTHLLLS
jgi:predicted AAA+ superfamily ATPase